MLLIVPGLDLETLMASSTMLERAWPDAYQEAMMLIHLLRVSGPSLADALAWGLISVLTPAFRKPTADIALVYRRAVLSGIACGENGVQVAVPHDRPREVTRLEVADLAVGGLSCLGMTG